MTKDAFWFRHDANLRDDRRIIDVRCKFGWEGYGLVCGILEVLRDQEGYTWSLDKLSGLAFVLKAEEGRLNEIVQTAIDSGFFEKCDPSSFHARMLTENMTQMNATRQSRVDGGLKRWAKKRSSSSARAEHESTLSGAGAIREDKIKSEVDNKTAEEGNAAPPSGIEERIEYAPRISMKPSEYQSLVKKVGQKAVDFYTRQCSDHLLKKNETTADGGALIRTWMRKDQHTKQSFFAGKNQNGGARNEPLRPERKQFQPNTIEKSLLNTVKVKPIR